MFGNNDKTNENRQKTPELSTDDVEAINVRQPVRLEAYAELYKAVTTKAVEAPMQALGSSALSDKGYIHPQTDRLNDPQAIQQAYRELGLLGNDVEASV